MIRIAIVEDERAAADSLQEYLGRYAAETGAAFEIRRFETGLLFLSGYDPDLDLVFMDIDMPDINGLDTASRLRQTDSTVGLVFITNLSRFAVNGYEYNAIDYILKPLSYPSLKLKLDRILNQIRKDSRSSIVISSRSGQYVVDINSIIYIEVSAHDVIYHTDQGDYKTYGTLKEAIKELPGSRFVQCNSCYIVNLSHVTGIAGPLLKVGGSSIEISRARRKPFLEAFNRYRMGERL